MKIGDKVRIITIPTDLPEGEIRTKPLFEMCVGKVFPIVGFRGHLLDLEIGEADGSASYMESIWIEPEHVRIID